MTLKNHKIQLVQLYCNFSSAHVEAEDVFIGDFLVVWLLYVLLALGHFAFAGSEGNVLGPLGIFESLSGFNTRAVREVLDVLPLVGIYMSARSHAVDADGCTTGWGSKVGFLQGVARAGLLLSRLQVHNFHRTLII